MTTLTATPDPATLPAAVWREDPESPDGPGILTPASSGIHLGTSRDGQPVALPAPGPAGLRVAVLGETLFGRLMALRLLAVGTMVTAATRVPDQWSGIHAAAGDRLKFTENPAAWPADTPAPPSVDAGPQALVSDQRRPPSPATASGAWRTVLHVTSEATRRFAFWHLPDALLALDASHAEAVGHLLGRESAQHTADLAPGEVILFRPHTATTEVLRLDIAPGETAILTPGPG
jgi:hypothetical protein